MRSLYFLVLVLSLWILSSMRSLLALEEFPVEKTKQFDDMIIKVEKDIYEGIQKKEWKPKDKRPKDTLPSSLMVGEWLAQKGQPDAAVYKYGQILKENPNDPLVIDRVYVYTALTYLKNQKYEKSINTYKEYYQKYGANNAEFRFPEWKSSKKQPFSFRVGCVALNGIAKIYKKNNKYNDALKYYQDYKSLIKKEIGKLTPEDQVEYTHYLNVDVPLDIADCYSGLKDYKNAYILYDSCKQYIETKGYPGFWDKELKDYWKNEDNNRLSKAIAECKKKMNIP